MPVLTLGINHKTAPVALREQVAIGDERLPVALRSLRQLPAVAEAAIVSTCNRLEIYATAEPGEEGRLTRSLVEWLGEFHKLEAGQIEECLYRHTGEAAVAHIMQVASGLDSLVLGEPQILGQMKNSVALARNAGTLGPVLERLFQSTFAVAKQVRHETGIGNNPVSVAFAAVSLARHIYSDFTDLKALFIGAGETVELAARHLRQQGVREMTMANRTLANAQKLAARFDGTGVLLGEIPARLEQADIVIASTASPLPIVGKGMVEKALGRRRHRPMLMIDLAVPRDIEAEVRELHDVYLYTVDDLEGVIQENLESRKKAAREAQAIIRTQAQKYLAWVAAQENLDAVRALREKVMAMTDRELERGLQRLRNGEPAEAVLAEMSRRLANKYLHTPTVQLRQAGERGRQDWLKIGRILFELEQDD